MSRWWRYAPLIAGLAAGVLLIAGVFLGLSIDRTYQKQRTDEATVQAEILASTATAALAFNDRQAATEYLNAIRANPEVEWAAIYDAFGGLFASFSRGIGQPPPSVFGC